MAIQLTHMTQLPDEELPVRLNDHDPARPFAVIDLDTQSYMVLHTVADAGRIIRAAAAARQMLIEATGAQVRVAIEDEDDSPQWCTATTDLGDCFTVYCDREPGHPGSHHAPGPDEGSEVAWSDEAEGSQA